MIEALVVRFAGWLIARRLAKHATVVGREEIAKRVRDALEYLPEDVVGQVEYQKSEAEILTERLTRRYDPGMAMNEATNRAVVLKAAARAKEAGKGLTPQQEAALKFQQEFLRKVAAQA